MAVVTQARVGQSPHAATGPRPTVASPERVLPIARVLPVPRVLPVHGDGRRPARLVAAPYRPAARSCEPRPMAGSVLWLILVGVAGFAVVLGIGWSMSGGRPSSFPERTVTVQMHQGDSLWTIAERAAPSADPSVVVDKIRQLNGLTAQSVVRPGQLLRVPADTPQH